MSVSAVGAAEDRPSLPPLPDFPAVVETVPVLGQACDRLGARFVFSASRALSTTFLYEISAACFSLQSMHLANPGDRFVMTAVEKMVEYEGVLRGLHQDKVSGYGARSVGPMVSDAGAYLIARDLGMPVVLRWIAREQEGVAQSQHVLPQDPVPMLPR